MQNAQCTRDRRHSRFRIAHWSAVLAATFLAFHLSYLPASLEDLDSINFALGVRQFDVTRHQPHPPGYPVFVLIAKGVHRFLRDEAQALAAVSTLAGTLGVLVLSTLFRRLDDHRDSRAWPLMATLIAVTAPLYWFTAARPLSDTTGLVAALAVQALALSAFGHPAESQRSHRLISASFCAALSAGLRSQVVWLTVPLLVFVVLRQTVGRVRLAVRCVAAFVVGGLLWAVPLVVLSGGPAAYWNALFSQGAEDLSGIQMLWTTPTPRQLASALYYAFVAPWARWDVAVVALLLAAAGAAAMFRSARATLALVAIAFGPYLVFDLLFQETVTTRYALPLVVPLAFFAARGATLGGRIGPAAAIALAMFNAHVAGTSLAAYAHQKAPVFRLLDDMRSLAGGAAQLPVIAMDRREDLDLRRPIAWLGDAAPRSAARLLAPPQHEWLESVRYWNGGGRAPVWFVADPKRAQIDLIQHDEPVRYRWSVAAPVLLGGVRPNEMDLYRLARPEWYLGQGWSLTPEIAGVTELDRRSPSTGPIAGWIHRSVLGGMLVLGGRNFDPVRARLTVALEGQPVAAFDAMPSAPFVRLIRLPQLATMAGDYGKLTVVTSAPARIAIEQFDASRSRPVFGLGDGWQEPEFNPSTGLRWRWLSERGEVRIAAATPTLLHLEGESPRKYFARSSRLVVRAADQVLLDRSLSGDFSVDVRIPWPSSDRALVLEADQFYVPADRSRQTQDRRRLGLRIFRCEVRAAF